MAMMSYLLMTDAMIPIIESFFAFVSELLVFHEGSNPLISGLKGKTRSRLLLPGQDKFLLQEPFQSIFHLVFPSGRLHR